MRTVKKSWNLIDGMCGVFCLLRKELWITMPIKVHLYDIYLPRKAGGPESGKMIFTETMLLTSYYRFAGCYCQMHVGVTFIQYPLVLLKNCNFDRPPLIPNFLIHIHNAHFYIFFVAQQHVLQSFQILSARPSVHTVNYIRPFLWYYTMPLRARSKLLTLLWRRSQSL